MRRVLLLDTETTSLDPSTGTTVEVGVILYDIAHATPIASFASLLHAETNAAENVNHIPVGALQTMRGDADVWLVVREWADECDAILAHNAEFDRGFVPADLRDSKPWICTRMDLDWPHATRPGASLVTLALEHGLGVASAHRALADCDLIARLLTRIAGEGVDLAAFLARGLRPKATYQAMVSFADRELAKAAGFGWEADRKRWTRTMAVEDAAKLPFPTRTI